MAHPGSVPWLARKEEVRDGYEDHKVWKIARRVVEISKFYNLESMLTPLSTGTTIDMIRHDHATSYNTGSTRKLDMVGIAIRCAGLIVLTQND